MQYSGITHREIYGMNTLKTGGFEFLASQWPVDSGRETLIFIHGAAMNCHSWETQIKGLSHQANIIAVNLPGRGESAVKACESISQNADYILAFMDQYRISRPIVCGLSMGGAVVLSLLIRSSDKIKAGVIINSGARLKVDTMILEAIKNDYEKFARHLGQFACSPKTDLHKINAELSMAIINNAGTAFQDFQACNAFDVMEKLGYISAPVLVLTATDDAITPAKHGEHLKRAIPNAVLTCIKDAGHLSPMETPERINKEIIKFHTSLI